MMSDNNSACSGTVNELVKPPMSGDWLTNVEEAEKYKGCLPVFYAAPKGTAVFTSGELARMGLKGVYVV